MKENSIEEDIKDIEKYISFTSKRENFSHDTDWNWNKDLANKIEHILSSYKKVLKENKELNEKWDKDTHKLQNDLDIANAKIIELLKENEELNKNYNSLIDKIILKIDEYDYKFEKAKRQNKNDIADYYWDLIGNFKKLLGGE